MDSGLGDFFQQIPQGFILMFCGSGILLALVIVYSIRERAKKARAFEVSEDVQPAAPSEAYFGDLPDLDDLAAAGLKPPAAPARPAGAHVVALAGGETVEVVEVLSVLRDVGEGGLIIQIGDKAYRNPPAYADADFKRRLHNTLRDLNAQQPVSAAPAAAPPPVSNGVSEAAESEDEDEVTLPPAAELPPAASQEVPRLSPYEPAPGDLPKYRMPDGPPVKPKRGQKLVREHIPELNIAGAIEAFLQHKLSRTTQYAGRSIHVVPAAHGGVKIEVDGTFYESVAEVADAGVRQFLSATIEEWQARQ